MGSKLGCYIPNMVMSDLYKIWGVLNLYMCNSMLVCISKTVVLSAVTF